MKHILLSAMLLISGFAHSSDIQTITGHKITGDDLFPSTLELAKISNPHSYGISFVNDKGDRILLPYGYADIQTCGETKTAAIVYSNIQLNSDEYDTLIDECDRPSYVRVWNTRNKYATYIFDIGD